MKLIKVLSILGLLVVGVGVLMGSGIAPAAYNLIQNAGTPVTRRSTLNFVNGGVADNPGSNRTDVTVLTAVPANFTCSFTTQTTVACTHNLNTTAVLVSVYDAASPPNLIIPATEQITSANVVTVTFSVATSGKVVVAGASGSGTSGVSSVQTATGAVTLFNNNAQTANYQVLAADFIACKTITVASGTFNVTLVASGSQPPDGQCVRVLNYGTGVVTVVRSGQNINGAAANQTISAGSASAATGSLCTSDGSNYFCQPLGSGGGAGVTQIIAGTNVTISPIGGTGAVTINSSGGGGGGTIPQSGWTVFNSPFYNDFSSSLQSLAQAQNNTNNLRGITRALPSSTSYTMTAQVELQYNTPDAEIEGGIVISDGTKYLAYVVDFQAGGSEPFLSIVSWSNTTTPVAAVHASAGLIGPNVALRIVGDATNRTYFYWSNGAYVQFFQEAIGTFLTETTGGYCIYANSGTARQYVSLDMFTWALTNP